MNIQLLFILQILATHAEDYNLYGFPISGYYMQMSIGHPPQKINLTVDTGSSTLAVAALPHEDVSKIYDTNQSTSLSKTGNMIKAKYGKGQWSAEQASDYIEVILSNTTKQVWSDVALIKSSEDFFINGSHWQGILGLAYKELSARGPLLVSKPWLESVEETIGKKVSFALKFCGSENETTTACYGSFTLIDETTPKNNKNKTFRTPILREIWYQIGVLSVRLKNKSDNINEINSKINDDCLEMNKRFSVIDSGMSKIVVPYNVFDQIVKQLIEILNQRNIYISDGFFYKNEPQCFKTVRRWPLPGLAIDILNADDYTQFFTIEVPPENYMKLASTDGDGTNNSYLNCYQFRIGPTSDTVTTVFGVVGLEGLQVTFNRSHRLIEFQESDCGPEVRITGPYNTTHILTDYCELNKPLNRPPLIELTWALCVVLSIALGFILYILFCCEKSFMPIRRTSESCRPMLDLRDSNT